MMGSKVALLSVLLALVCLTAVVQAKPAWWSITMSSGSWKVESGRTSGFNTAAEAYYDAESMATTGWQTLGLYTHASSTLSPQNKAYGAGYLEGHLTHESIWQSYLSTLESSFGQGVKQIPAVTAKFLQDNIDWVRSAIHNNALRKEAGYMFQILVGMVDGYNGVAPEGRELTLLDFWMMNSNGDLEEIVDLKPSSSKKGIPVSPQPTGSHCSVLVKVTPDFSNLFMGHTTWENFVGMLRIYKVYDLDILGSRVSFSSYPALVTSVDDFYVTSQNLAITETTNGIFTPELFQKIVPQTLLSWTRAFLANIGATNCHQWMNIFGQHNSGTYNNQWMCLDYKLFQKGKSLKPGTFWIGEQIPGRWETADVTSTLALGYWPSYNVPYFPEIYNASGFTGQFQQWGDFFSYSLCPRAKIFRRDQSKVTDLEAMKKIMRYNNWENDPFSDGNPCNQIASRCDLVTDVPKNPDLRKAAFGSVDGKIVDADSIQHGGVWAQSGPTFDQQPAFTWDNPSWKAQSHGGQPETFKFAWEYMYEQFP